MSAQAHTGSKWQILALNPAGHKWDRGPHAAVLLYGAPSIPGALCPGEACTPWSPRAGGLRCFWVDILVHEASGRSWAYCFTDLVRPRALVGFLGQGASWRLLSQILPGIPRGGGPGLHALQFCGTHLSATLIFSAALAVLSTGQTPPCLKTASKLASRPAKQFL